MAFFDRDLVTPPNALDLAISQIDHTIAGTKHLVIVGVRDDRNTGFLM